MDRVASPVKLQGVGPGGFQGTTYVPGSIIDAGAFGGDTDLATAWYAKLGTLAWDGNQAVNDGEAIYVLASNANGGTHALSCADPATGSARPGPPPHVWQCVPQRLRAGSRASF